MGKYEAPGAIPWTRPTYLNIDWDRNPNDLPNPHVQVSVMEALEAEYSVSSYLRGIAFDQCWVGVHLYNVHYRFYDDRAYALGLYFTSRNMARRLSEDKGGEVWDCYFMPGYAYHVVAFRIGCTHPNMKDYWAAPHERVQKCPDCGYEARFDTSG